MKDVKFGKDGLVPVITADAYTGRVLMQAYMNAEALDKTLATREAHYFSRSRNALWRKGETSGHFQRVVSLCTDCDNDCVLMRVVQTGAACHTGAYSCFFNNETVFEDIADPDVLRELESTIESRRNKPVDGSYTNYLLQKGREKICKKVGEESSEVIIAAMKDDKDELLNELADLYYHTFVLMNDRGVTFNQVLRVLKDRHSTDKHKKD
ncbi:MAG: bifunctional phosphoribosyl-AMP cyclohydrolase/phosphoribosyl-ATP diphosphatase HisIE [Clostridiales bacterium]|jgi:phosphoribosyl-ATP pyrophosphohydrolase/phosphoribosyl-AMP cyclohydrolase|nr:bifunctional phosphoribosyl-AMP cyclohydrolase/phosphoribosyl-ATP diphosphatase HisIE [Clostridiales bacterium]